MAKFSKVLLFQNYSQYLRVLNMQKEMKSKMYVVLIIIWLMYLPRGKIILLKKTKKIRLFENVELKLSTLVRTPKMNRLFKKRIYIVDIVAAVLFFLFCVFNASTIFKSSHQRCSIKQTVFKIFAIFTGKHLQALRSVTLLKRDSNTGVFM